MEISFFGSRVQTLSMDQVDSYLEEALAQGKKTRIYTLNTEIVIKAKDKAWIRDLSDSGDFRLADGIGLVVGVKINKIPLEERVTGFDANIHLLQIAQRKGYKVYFLRARKGIAQKTVQEVEKDYPGLVVVRNHYGYYERGFLDQDLAQDEEEVIEEVQRLQADIVLVGPGFPIQEVSIHEAGQRLGRGVWIGDGGVLDILTKEQKWASEIFTRLHPRWFYRLIKNPGRWKRQLAIPKFLIQVITERNAVEIVRENFNKNEPKSN